VVLPPATLCVDTGLPTKPLLLPFFWSTGVHLISLFSVVRRHSPPVLIPCRLPHYFPVLYCNYLSMKDGSSLRHRVRRLNRYTLPRNHSSAEDVPGQCVTRASRQAAKQTCQASMRRWRQRIGRSTQALVRYSSALATRHIYWRVQFNNFYSRINTSISRLPY